VDHLNDMRNRAPKDFRYGWVAKEAGGWSI
jgi:hypothetical protein